MLWLGLPFAALLLAWAIYPGELSWLPGKGHLWLYNRAAKSYHRKWRRHDYRPYDELIGRAAAEAASLQQTPRVADLACGTGRATTAAVATLGASARYHAVDFAPAMLQQFRQRIAEEQQLQACDITLQCQELGQWLPRAGEFELVLLMEAAEFVPANRRLAAALGRATVGGGLLVMTRPAGLWSALFPARGQSRRLLLSALQAAGFEAVEFIPWRCRYELVLAKKSA